MKKLLILCSFAFLLNGCGKDSDNCSYTETNATATASEIAYLQAYAATNYPAAIQHTSGFFYEISAPGTGATPNICSNVTVKYSLYNIATGVKIEENTTGVSFSLGVLIPAWQRGIPLIKEGGSILLLVPPSLGYQDGVYMRFYIQLVAVR
jgi:FKBP-type peptidyl-prolyl cis-trans isomerase FkpA